MVRLPAMASMRHSQGTRNCTTWCLRWAVLTEVLRHVWRSSNDDQPEPLSVCDVLTRGSRKCDPGPANQKKKKEKAGWEMIENGPAGEEWELLDGPLRTL